MENTHFALLFEYEVTNCELLEKTLESYNIPFKSECFVHGLEYDEMHTIYRYTFLNCYEAATELIMEKLNIYPINFNY